MCLQNRILVIGYLPGINGISTSVLNLYRNLDRDRYQYDFLLPEKYRENMTPDLEEIRSLGADLYYMDYEKYHFPETSRSDLKQLMLSIPNLRGVHVHDLNMMSYPLYLADQLGFPIKVMQCHTAKNRRETAAKKRHPGFEERRKLIEGEQFDRLACSDLAGQYDYYDLPYTIMPNAVDIERFSYNSVYRLLIRKQLGIPEQSTVIGSVSGLSPGKNHLFAIQVFCQFLKMQPDSHYLIVGSGHQAFSIKKSIEEERISDRVHLVGAQREVDLFYSAMDILVHPSLSEGLPNTLVEAQATGLPCLMSDQISDMARITTLVTALSLDEGAADWAKKISEIINALDERRSRGEELKAAGYDIRDAAKKLMQLYDSRIKSNPK